MALNFEKAQAFVLENFDGSKKIDFGDKQIDKLIQLISTEPDLLSRYGTYINPSEIGQGSITYLKDVDQGEWIGAEADDETKKDIAKAEPITIYLNSLWKKHTELSAFDMTSLLSDVMARKLVQFNDRLQKHRYLEGFKALKNKAVQFGWTTPAAGATEYDKAILMWYDIQTIANKMTKIVSKENGIYFIDKSQINIDLDLLVFPIIVAAMRGNNTEKAFTEGLYSISRIGSFEVIGNKFLDDGEVLIGTNFLGKAPYKIVQSYVGPKTSSDNTHVAKLRAKLCGKDNTAGTTGFEFVYEPSVATPATPSFKTDFIVLALIKKDGTLPKVPHFTI